MIDLVGIFSDIQPQFDVSDKLFNSTEVKDNQRSVCLSRYWKELACKEIITLMFVRFIGQIGLSSVETIVTPFMRKYFDYGDFERMVPSPIAKKPRRTWTCCKPCKL